MAIGRAGSIARNRIRFDRPCDRLIPVLLADYDEVTITVSGAIPSAPIIGIIGSGTMGRGIAQIAAAAGCPVRLADARPGAAEQAKEHIAEMFARTLSKGTMSPEAMAAALDRIVPVANDPDAMRACDVVIEAVIEDLDLKRTLFQALEDAVGDDCILATNTSSLSVTAIAAGCRRPDRVAGLHFFNPVPLMKLVEVIGGVLTAPEVVTRLCELVRRFGHHPVVAADTPGFLVNHASRGYGLEALRILSEGIAQPVDIDRVMRESAGFRMGPFELFDLTALDVSQPVMEAIYGQFYHEPRYRPSGVTRQRLEAGLLGRKSGRGFYDYPGGTIAIPPEMPVPEWSGRPVWIDPAWHEACTELSDRLIEAGITLDRGDRPAADAVIVIMPVGRDVTAGALAAGLDPARTVGVDPLFGFTRRITLMTNPVTATDARDAAHAALAATGAKVTVIHDSPGFIAQRIVAMIVNVGCDIAQARIGTPADIDRAVMLGLGYPFGPLGFGDRIGGRRVLEILDALEGFYGDPRYRPSPWLKRRALLGVSLTTPEG